MIDPTQLLELSRVVDVDEVVLWQANPSEGDVGAIHASLDAFGQLEPILISGGVVYSGNHRVMAERRSRYFGGRLLAVDVTSLDWPEERITAAAIALNRIGRRGRFDTPALAEALSLVAELDPSLLEVTGFDGEDLDRFIADSLRGLPGGEYGTGSPDRGAGDWPRPGLHRSPPVPVVEEDGWPSPALPMTPPSPPDPAGGDNAVQVGASWGWRVSFVCSGRDDADLAVSLLREEGYIVDDPAPA